MRTREGNRVERKRHRKLSSHSSYIIGDSMTCAQNTSLALADPTASVIYVAVGCSEKVPNFQLFLLQESNSTAYGESPILLYCIKGRISREHTRLTIYQINVFETSTWAAQGGNTASIDSGAAVDIPGHLSLSYDHEQE